MELDIDWVGIWRCGEEIGCGWGFEVEMDVDVDCEGG